MIDRTDSAITRMTKKVFIVCRVYHGVSLQFYQAPRSLIFTMKTLLSILTIPLFLVACSADDSVQVSQVLMGGTVNERNEIENQQTTFSPTQNSIFAHAFVQNLQGEALVQGEWWYDTGDSRKIYQASVTLDPEHPVAKFTLQSTQDWPKGDYRFVLVLDGETLSETEFSVE